MNIKTVQSGICATNSYLVEKDGLVFLIDAPDDNERMISFIKESGKLTSVFLTHGHFDHVMGIGRILEEFPSTAVYLSSNDKYLINDKMKGNPHFLSLFGIPASMYNIPKNIVFTPYPERISGIKIIETPGHTPGSVSLYFEDEKVLFSGDTLFFHSYGRTDLGGNSRELQQSLRHLLLSLDEETVVMPGHGGYTLIKDERMLFL